MKTIFRELFRWMLSSYSAIVRLVIQKWLFLNMSSLWVGQMIVLAVYTVELKVEGRLQLAIKNPPKCLFVLCMKNAEQVFDLLSCHIWRHVVITGYDDRFRRVRNRLIFRLHFLQLGNSKTITTDGNRPAPWLSSLEALYIKLHGDKYERHYAFRCDYRSG